MSVNQQPSTTPHGHGNQTSKTMIGHEPEGYFYLAVKVNQTGYAHVLCCQTCGSLVGNTIAHNDLCEYGKGSGNPSGNAPSSGVS